VDAPVSSRRAIEIAAPPEVVWEVLTGFGEWPQWNPDVKSMSYEGPLAPEVVHLGSSRPAAPAIRSWTDRYSST
jgi:hypothetical protein